MYTAGVLAWELHSGRRLFEGGSRNNVLAHKTALERLHPFDLSPIPASFQGTVAFLIFSILFVSTIYQYLQIGPLQQLLCLDPSRRIGILSFGRDTLKNTTLILFLLVA